MSIQVISFNCLLKNKTGQLISTTFNRNVINTSEGQDAILNRLAKGLQNLTKGERRSIELTAEEAYGLYEPKKMILYPRSKLPRVLKLNETVSIAGKSGLVRVYKVSQIRDDMVSLDGNHPLAGQDLVFEIEALDAREATSDEIADSATTSKVMLLH